MRTDRGARREEASRTTFGLLRLALTLCLTLVSLTAEPTAALAQGLGASPSMTGEVLDDRLLPPVERATVRLPEDPLAAVSTDSTSLGTAEDGHLEGGTHLPRRGPHHAVLPEHRGRTLHYGTAELIDLIEHTGAWVAARYPGARLPVGNLSRQGGGDIPYSFSHNSGRDVDLAFFYETLNGRPVSPAGFREVRPDGVARHNPGLRLDVARTWAILEGLLSHATVQVQWLYIEQNLRQLLLEHAAAEGADPDLLQRASVVMRQPTYASPHDDHIHVRIYCSPDDLLDGCRDTGPRRPWVENYELAYAERVEQLVAVLRVPAQEGSAEPEGDSRAKQDLRRGAAIERLVTIQATEAALTLVQLLPEQTGPVREKLASALGALGVGEVAVDLARLAAEEAEPSVARALLEAVSSLRRPEAVAQLVPLLQSTRDPEQASVQALPPWWERASESERYELRGLLLRALGSSGARHAAPVLIEELAHARPVQRQEAARALHRLTNRRSHHEAWWAQGSPRRARQGRARASWQRWWRKHGQESRESWLAKGFASAGYRLEAPFSFKSSWRIIGAQSDRRDYLRRNAEDLLREMARIRPIRPSEAPKRNDYWKVWWLRLRRAQRFAG